MAPMSSTLPSALSAANPVPEVSPNPSALPGGAALQTLIDGLAFYALAIAVAVLIGGAAAWALGSNTGNLEWATNGKRATVVAACWRRNWRQLSRSRCGAGGRPAAARIVRTEVAETVMPRPRSSPTIRW